MILLYGFALLPLNLFKFDIEMVLSQLASGWKDTTSGGLRSCNIDISTNSEIDILHERSLRHKPRPSPGS